jgi:hypothetical protein
MLKNALCPYLLAEDEAEVKLLTVKQGSTVSIERPASFSPFLLFPRTSIHNCICTSNPLM